LILNEESITIPPDNGIEPESTEKLIKREPATKKISVGLTNGATEPYDPAISEGQNGFGRGFGWGSEQGFSEGSRVPANGTAGTGHLTVGELPSGSCLEVNRGQTILFFFKLVDLRPYSSSSTNRESIFFIIS